MTDASTAVAAFDPELRLVLERLQRLEDEAAIARRLAAYGHGIDYGDEAGWLDCFTDDARFEVTWRRGQFPPLRCEGREQLAALIASHTRAPTVWHKHVLVDPLITLDGDEASVTSYFLRLDAQSTGFSQVVGMGRYRDRLVRCPDGAWRFRHRIGDVEDQ